MKEIKKLLALLLALTMVFTFAACGGESASEEPAEEPAQEEPAETAEEPAEEPSAETETPGKTLVVFFSRVGNSDFSGGVDAVSSASLIDEGGEFVGNAQKIAEIIAGETGGDLVEVVVKNPYPGDYNETVNQAKEEQNNDARPELVTVIDNLGEYGTVYLAFPNWWGDLPMALYTFFDEYDFSGKTIKVFATHEGSGFSGTIGTIKELEPGAEVIEGLSIRGSDVPDSEEDIAEWVQNN